MSVLRRVDGTTVWRTPDARFASLPDYPFAANYVDIADARLGALRMHYVDENPRARRTVLLLHGEPSWSFLYRFMIPPLADAGFRVLAPDLVGFGRSDKPGHVDDYSYAGHVRWMRAFVEQLALKRVTLFCQDWGGLIGLRVLAETPDRFARLVVANTGLPDGGLTLPRAFRTWQRFARWSPLFPIGRIIDRGCHRLLDAAEIAAYDAPFPDRRYKAAARALPQLVPTHAGERDLPVLTLFSDRDPITRGGDRPFRKRLPGAAGQPHHLMRGGGHFLQEDVGPELAERIIAFAAGQR